MTGTQDKAGFYSAIRLETTSAITWSDADYFAPGVLYGDPTYDGDNSPGGVLNYRARRFALREDELSAPLFALSFRDGRWAAVMDLAPRGDTTWAETTAPATTPVIDDRIQFGALGAREVSRMAASSSASGFLARPANSLEGFRPHPLLLCGAVIIP